MLLTLTDLRELDRSQLMAVYREANLENAAYFEPEARDSAQAVRRCEERFWDYLQHTFFTGPGRVYWALTQNGLWVSVLRTTEVEPQRFYLEALETHPDYRGQGFATKLLRALLQALAAAGPFELWDCVRRTNLPSIRAHRSAGFVIAADPGYDYLSGAYNPQCYGMGYFKPDSGEL